MPVSEFDIGDQIRIRVTFTQDGTNTDPTEVTFRMLEPDATETTEIYNGGAGNVSREAAGIFYYDHTVGQSGVHTYRWKGTGAVVAASPDVQFRGRVTEFSNP